MRKVWILVILLGVLVVLMAVSTTPVIMGASPMVPVIYPGDCLLVDRISYRFRAPKPGDIILFRLGSVAIAGTDPGSVAAAARDSTGGRLLYVNGTPAHSTEQADEILSGLAQGTTIRLETSTGVYNLGLRTASPQTLKSLGLVAKNTYTRSLSRVIATGGQTVQIRDGGVYVDAVRLQGARFDRHYDSTLARMQYGVGPTLVPDNQVFVLGDNSRDSFDSRYWGFVAEQDIIGVPFLRILPLSRFGAM